MTRLDKLGFTNEAVKKDIVDSLYPNAQSKL